jgi:hypothetical protein
MSTIISTISPINRTLRFAVYSDSHTDRTQRQIKKSQDCAKLINLSKESTPRLCTSKPPWLFIHTWYPFESPSLYLQGVSSDLLRQLFDFPTKYYFRNITNLRLRHTFVIFRPTISRARSCSCYLILCSLVLLLSVVLFFK